MKDKIFLSKKQGCLKIHKRPIKKIIKTKAISTQNKNNFRKKSIVFNNKINSKKITGAFIEAIHQVP